MIADICKLSNIQEKLVLLFIPGRIQHLLAAVPMNLSRDFAKQHDEALFDAGAGAVAATLELGNLTDRDGLLMQRKLYNHGLGLRSMEKNLEFLFLVGFMQSITSVKHTFSNFNKTLQYTIQGDSGLRRQLANALSILHKLPSAKLQELLSDTISAVLVDDFLWRHDEIQR